MRAADIPHAAHVFWSMQDTVIAPLKMRPIPSKIYDFWTSWLDIRIVVLRVLSLLDGSVKTP
jgi:hypothetical protein